MAEKSTGDVDLHLFAVLVTGVVDTFFKNTISTARMLNASIPVDYDEVLRDKIVKFLIEYPKRKTDAPFDKRLLQEIFNVLNEHSKRTTAPFIRFLEKSFYLSDEKVTWYEANKTCIDMGASLITLEENDEKTLLLQFLKVNFDRNWWVFIDPEHLPNDSLCLYLCHKEKMDHFLNVGGKCNNSNYFICEK